MILKTLSIMSEDNDGVYKDWEITWTKEKVADGESFEVTFKVKVNDNVNGEKILITPAIPGERKHPISSMIIGLCVK